MLPSLVICLQFDKNAQNIFETARQEHYPRHHNHAPAHCTVLHKVPMEHAGLRSLLTDPPAAMPFTAEVGRLLLYPNGVAYSLSAPQLHSIYSAMQKTFAGYLVAADRKPFSPHVTIQNRVTAFKAKQLHRRLSETFKPFPVEVHGLSIYTYHRGNWEVKETISFKR